MTTIIMTPSITKQLSTTKTEILISEIKKKTNLTDEEKKERIRASKRRWVKNNLEKYRIYNKRAYEKRKLQKQLLEV